MVKNLLRERTRPIRNAGQAGTMSTLEDTKLGRVAHACKIRTCSRLIHTNRQEPRSDIHSHTCSILCCLAV